MHKRTVNAAYGENHCRLMVLLLCTDHWSWKRHLHDDGPVRSSSSWQNRDNYI